MRILIVGANGNVGRLALLGLAGRHEIVTVGRSGGDIRADISSPVEIERMYASLDGLDACICAAGDSETRALDELKTEHVQYGVEQKLFSQINLVLKGMRKINANGSFTLVSGKMGDHPAAGSIGKSVVNAAINNFVIAAAQELDRGVRINAVSPAKLGSVPDEQITEAFRRSVESDDNGVIYRIY
ncbi:MAG: short chain dehydrogenase [Pyrinomonadaceae bacterium]